MQNDVLLMLAVQNNNTAPKHAGHLEIVDFLLKQGAKPNLGTLFEVARDGNQAVVDRFIAGGVELDVFACSLTGDVARLKKLVARHPHLVSARTSSEIKNYRDFTPLHACCLSALNRQSPEMGKSFLQVAKLLVKNGAELNPVGMFYGQLVVTPLDMLAHSGGNLELSRYLIDSSAVISPFAFLEALSHRGRSLAEGFALAEQFLELGFDVDALQDDRTALHAAANTGGSETVRWLLEHGANVNARGRMGRTPLHLAAERNTSKNTAEVLVQFGADVTAKDEVGLTPLEVAERHGKGAVAKWLRQVRS